MSDKSILLGLDGSAQARYAAELAWSMAKSGSMRVDAQHVIDSLAAWDFLNFDIAGFIGSGPYFEAHETMRNCLQELGRNLVGVYSTIALQNGVESNVFLDEGTTIREICARAKKYDLVVIGQRGTGMGAPDEDNRKLPRRSIPESLTHYCSKPLLVVGDRVQMWTKARIVLGATDVPAASIANAVKFLQGLHIEPAVRCIYEKLEGAKADKTLPDGLKVTNDITKEVPDLKDRKVEVRTVESYSEYLKSDADQEPETLMVVPVLEIDGVRTTPFGWSPDEVIRYLNHPAVLFWIDSASIPESAKSSKSVSKTV